ncbi:hypothetical protein GCM10011383_23350 [Hymenobacter cavernae]|uniref:DUF4232 domain-containing protein n=2 Tax=Hymenobacter cavernae TaxID=2044852 RepID=A0ABQ1U7M0_9BACT|nr:hypothetical protein GCM10011383_23350 [Hymenobacter cavernae]
MKKLGMLLGVLVVCSRAFGQTKCPNNVVRVYQNGQEVNTKGSALIPKINLAITSDPACGAATTYPFKHAEITLIRGKYPVLPIYSVTKAEVDLTPFKKWYKPGDRLFIEAWGGEAAQRAQVNWILDK